MAAWLELNIQWVSLYLIQTVYLRIKKCRLSLHILARIFNLNIREREFFRNCGGITVSIYLSDNKKNRR